MNLSLEDIYSNDGSNTAQSLSNLFRGAIYKKSSSSITSQIRGHIVSPPQGLVLELCSSLSQFSNHVH